MDFLRSLNFFFVCVIAFCLKVVVGAPRGSSHSRRDPGAAPVSACWVSDPLEPSMDPLM